MFEAVGKGELGRVRVRASCAPKFSFSPTLGTPSTQAILFVKVSMLQRLVNERADDSNNVTTAVLNPCSFLTKSKKDMELRKWAAEGLSFLTMDAEVKVPVHHLRARRTGKFRPQSKKRVETVHV